MVNTSASYSEDLGFDSRPEIRLTTVFVGTQFLEENSGITPRGRVLPEKLTVIRLVKIFSEFYGARRFITMFTRALCNIS
jgi:hypothetical protein